MIDLLISFFVDEPLGRALGRVLRNKLFMGFLIVSALACIVIFSKAF